MNKDELIEDCYKTLKLDNRASKREVELAFEALTGKNMHIEDYKVLRNAFEILMKEVYGFSNTKGSNMYDNIQPNDENDDDDIEEKCKAIIRVLPDKVIESLKDCSADYDERAKAFFCVQNINLPMLISAFKNKCHNFLSFKFWTKNDINKIIQSSCLNNFVYNDLTFELSYNEESDLRALLDLQSFAHNLKSMYDCDKETCKLFQCKNTQYGVMGHVIAEHSIIEGLNNLLKTKSEQVDCYLNATVSPDGF